MPEKKLILFIHGLLGDDDSWGNFEHLLTKHEKGIFEHYDVKFFSYPSEVLKDPKIQTIAKSLRTTIENDYPEYNDIILVCHSMGGLVAKKYLIDEIKIYRPKALKVKKVIFYDTPHNGADIANWAKVTTHSQVSQMATNSDFIEFLNTDFYTMDIDKYLCMKYVIAEKKYMGIKVVSTQSASAVWANRDTETLIDKHHKDCCKPKDLDDMSYKILKNFILKECPRVDLSPQPYLENKALQKQTELNRFNYKNDFIPFVGREKEYEFLDDFCQDERKFLWTVMYEDGGTGKSRLGFEYAKNLKSKSNNAGFYTLLDDFEWQNWHPSVDTFVVLDYAGSNPREIQKILSKLTERSSYFINKVRILLLERSLTSYDNWYSDVLLGGSGSIIEDSQYKDPYAIGILCDEALISIAHKFDKSIDKDDFISKLQALDENKRPLFAAILAEGFKKDIINLNKTVLIKTYLKRTKDRYWSDIDSSYMLLASLLTIVEKSNVRQLSHEILSDCCPIDLNTTKLEALLGESESDWVYRGIEPDIIGELFVLEMLGEHNTDRLSENLMSEDTRKVLLSYIWEKHPLKMVIFLERCRLDYLKHTGFVSIYNYQNITTETGAYLWALHSVNLISDWGEQDITKAQEIFEGLQALSKVYPNNEEIASEVAKASFNLISDWGEQDITKAQEIFEGLQALSKVYPNNEEIALEVAKASFNLISDWGEQDITKAQEIFEGLQALSKVYPNNEEIALSAAKASVNLISGWRKQDITKAQEIFEGLQALSKVYPNNEEIALEVAKASFNLINGWGEQDITKAQEIFEGLQALSKVYPNNEEIALEVAKASFNLISDWGEQDITKAQEIFEGLQALSKVYPNNEEIALRVAQASVNLISGWRKQDITKAQEIFEGLQALSKVYPNNEEIALSAAKASFNLINGWGEQDITKAQEIFEGLQALSKVYPNNEEIALEVAKASVNLISDWGEQDITKAQEIFEGLQALSKVYPNNEEIALRVAQASVIIIYFTKDKELALFLYLNLEEYIQLHEVATQILKEKKWL